MIVSKTMAKVYSEPKSTGVATGAIIGIVIAGLFAFLLLVALVHWIWRRSTRRREYDEESSYDGQG